MAMPKNHWKVAFQAQLEEECKLAQIAKHNEMYGRSSKDILNDWIALVAVKLTNECKKMFGECLTYPYERFFDKMAINLLQQGDFSATYGCSVLIPKPLACDESVMAAIADALKANPMKLSVMPLDGLKSWCAANGVKETCDVQIQPIGDGGALLKLFCHLDWSEWITNPPKNRKFSSPLNGIRSSRRNIIDNIAKRIDDGIWLKFGLDLNSAGVNFNEAMKEYIIENSKLGEYGVRCSCLAQIDDLEQRYLALEPFETVEKRFQKYFSSDAANLKSLIKYCKNEDLKLHLAYSQVDSEHISVEICIYW